MKKRIFTWINSVLVSVFLCGNTLAADRFVTLNDATSIELEQEIGTVFISQPEIADYKVTGKNKLVVYGRQLGQARLFIYNKAHEVILSELLHVDLNLSQIRRQLKLVYPELDISLASVGDKVAVRGVVYSEEQRSDIYRQVATFLGREKIERFDESELVEFKDSFTEANWLAYERNFTWQGIIEGLTLSQTQQVNVKVSVAQVTKEFNETLGVNWSTVGRSVGEFSFLDFKADDLTTVINALGKDSIAEVLAEPNLSVMSGESASFLVGGEIPVIFTNNNTTNITYKEFGIRLDLSAKVLNNDKIKLQMMPEVSAVEGFIEAAGIKIPQLTTRRAMTTIELGDGDSFLLGGLMSSDELENISKIPLLGDIPVFGSLFRQAGTSRKKTELVIVATVNLVKPLSPAEIRLPKITPTKSLARFFNVTPAAGENENINVIQMLNQGGFIQ
ncbi:pilus assembly protein N-terminal domain-containing protein [Shewanella marinintestina]|uniref:type II and III secretion system protein family protein n=1 Tax=Shewanella marinintestina TaxID=190305 RepID=UPI00200C1AC4|nr:pilus assembly protein N-terminal domain-containing protein [Shewanella marinintestina]MCL1145369.1 pilus assembly protein N-terminal domain-containing protein [Shewanella marinintestina]